MREVNKIIRSRFTKKYPSIYMENDYHFYVLLIYYLGTIEYVHKSVQGAADEKI